MINVSWKTNFDQVAFRLEKRVANFEVKKQEFFKRKKASYAEAAKMVLESVIYAAYTPKRYRRTGASSDAVDYAITEDGAMIFLNPQKANILSGGGKGIWKYYPMFMISGAKTIPQSPRNFLLGWKQYFEKVFKRDFDREVVGKITK